MKCSKITVHVFIMMVIALMPFTDSLAQTKPKQSKEAILEWLCQKIEENYSGAMYTSDDFREDTYQPNTRHIKSCTINNGNIEFSITCSYRYKSGYNWQNIKVRDRADEDYIDYNIMWMRKVIIPINSLKSIEILTPLKPELSHQNHLVLKTLGNKIAVVDDKPFRYEDESTNPYHNKEEKAMKENASNNYFKNESIIRLNSDPALKERIEKALVDLNSYFVNKEPY